MKKLLQKTSASLQKEKNMSNEIKMKMITVQKIIKNKFKEAYANRIEHENNQLMHPTPMDSSNDAISQSIAKQSRPMTSSKTKVDDSKNYKSSNNANELCNRLRILLSMTASEPKDNEEMNAIIIKLHELEILV